MSRYFLICLISLLFWPQATPAQGVRDPALPEIGYFQTLPSVSAKFPKGVDGRPDWVQTLQQGLIAPRSTKSGAPREPESGVPMPQDGIVFKNTQFMPYVVFPHRQHAEWLSCMNCHESLFELKATGRGKGMTAIFRGEHCGFCHGRVAFSPEGSCYRCHSQPNPNAVANTPFKAPATIEPAVTGLPAEEAPRSRRGKPVFQAGRLAPSVVPPPAPPPVAPAVAPVLQ